MTDDQWDVMWRTFGDLANAAHQARDKTQRVA